MKCTFHVCKKVNGVGDVCRNCVKMSCFNELAHCVRACEVCSLVLWKLADKCYSTGGCQVQVEDGVVVVVSGVSEFGWLNWWRRPRCAEGRLWW